MDSKKVTLKECLGSGSKTEVVIKKILVVLMAFYLLYKLGYVVGTFIANIGL